MTVDERTLVTQAWRSHRLLYLRTRYYWRPARHTGWTSTLIPWSSETSAATSSHSRDITATLRTGPADDPRPFACRGRLPSGALQDWTTRGMVARERPRRQSGS